VAPMCNTWLAGRLMAILMTRHGIPSHLMRGTSLATQDDLPLADEDVQRLAGEKPGRPDRAGGQTQHGAFAPILDPSLATLAAGHAALFNCKK